MVSAMRERGDLTRDRAASRARVLPRVRALVVLAAVAGLGTALPAWALHWPWHHHAKVASTQAVSVLAVMDGGAPTAAHGARIAQYWERNTLLVDITHLRGAGSATLTPVAANGGWPVRLEFRVQPGTIARLQVQGAQRVTFVVPAHGAAEVLKLDPGVYLADTAHITVRWRAAADSSR